MTESGTRTDSRELAGRTEKIQKYLARAGVCSRRDAEELVSAGRVTVNGVVASVGMRVDPARDTVAVDGRVVTPAPRLVYVMLNKPKGVVTTAEDERGRRTVLDLVSRHYDLSAVRLFPVGRLDKDSTGLLLLTNDGDLAYRLLHPKEKIPKVYRVEVKGHPSRRKLAELEDGIVIEGRKTLPCKIQVLRKRATTTVLRVILYEGRKRQIRRMMRAINHPVVELERVEIGPLSLGRLKRGSFRELTPEEVASLRRYVGLAD